MIYFCADDYGMSKQSNSRIEKCIENGALNKVSVLPNGDTDNITTRLPQDVMTSLHLNLIEGKPLSNPKDIDLLISKDGNFRYSFIGLFFLSLTPKRKKLKEQLYKEIKSQIDFWRGAIGEESPISIDSHQHTHMIPVVFKTLMKVISDGGVQVEYMRMPSEPISPYILAPSLYLTYSPINLVKQWLLNILAIHNRKELNKSKIKWGYFMGVLFSGNLTQNKIKKTLPHYIKLGQKRGRDIEIAFHPGYHEDGEKLIDGSRKGFDKFYYSKNRKKEFDTLLNSKF